MIIKITAPKRQTLTIAQILPAFTFLNDDSVYKSGFFLNSAIAFPDFINVKTAKTIPKNPRQNGIEIIPIAKIPPAPSKFLVGAFVIAIESKVSFSIHPCLDIAKIKKASG